MKKFLPHIIAIVAFLVITFIYFFPLLEGKELKQSDINNWKGMAQEIISTQEKTGDNVYWTNSMFGGMPGYQISAIYGANLVQYIDKAIMFLPAPANLFFLYLLGFYFLLMTLKVDSRVAIIGSLAFAFSSYMILFLVTGHNSKAHAIGYMAPVIAGIIMTYRGRMLLGAALTGLFLALELNANHLQITYYLMIVVVLLGLTELYTAFREKRLGQFAKATALLGLMAVLAVATNITNLWATQEYGKYSTRGPSELTENQSNKTSGLDRDYITDWSYGIGESWTFLVPDFKGGATEGIAKNNKDVLKKVDDNFRQNIAQFSAYFGDQPFTGGPLYLGAIVCMLFVIGLFVVKGPMKWWLLISTVLFLMLGWGKNLMWFTNLFLDYVPGYDKFRAVTTTLIVLEFTVPFLAILAVDKMVKEPDFFSKYKKQINYSLIAVLGIIGLMCVAPGVFTSFYTPSEYDQVSASVKGQNISQDVLDGFFNNLSEARKQIVVSDAVRSFMFLLLAAALIWTYLRYRYSKDIFVYGLMFLVVFDLATVGKRYLLTEDFVKKSANAVPFPMSQADQIIKQDTTQSYRVLNLAANVFNDASTSYYHQSIGGYHGAKLKRYKELIDYSLTPELAALKGGMQKADSTFPALLRSQPALNMLNTKYIIYNPDAAPLLNPGALGNAWFVQNLKEVANADSEIAAVSNFNPAATAVIDVRFKDQLNGFQSSADSSASIVLTKYSPEHLVYSSKSSSEQFAVFSEIYYDKGWNVYVDGKQMPYARVDYVLRGMRIPAGTHTVEWKFEPEVIRTGEKVALASSALLILLVGGLGWMEWKKSRGANAA
ncbi:MAG TPA: YfhO family protein [Bacteroidia bacterium]|nr:YfhO family protein [Bacteroidia bacterium]